MARALCDPPPPRPTGKQQKGVHLDGASCSSAPAVRPVTNAAKPKTSVCCTQAGFRSQQKAPSRRHRRQSLQPSPAHQPQPPPAQTPQAPCRRLPLTRRRRTTL